MPIQQIAIIAAWIALTAFEVYATYRSGGTNRAIAASILAMIAILLAAALGRSAPWIVAATIAYAAIMLLRGRWIPAVGGLRAEAGLFRAYRRLYRAVQTERTDATIGRGPSTDVLAELANLDRWRTPNTSRLIDLLRETYEMDVAGDAPGPVRHEAFQALDREMIRVWGKPKRDPPPS